MFKFLFNYYIYNVCEINFILTLFLTPTLLIVWFYVGQLFLGVYNILLTLTCFLHLLPVIRLKQNLFPSLITITQPYFIFFETMIPKLRIYIKFLGLNHTYFSTFHYIVASILFHISMSLFYEFVVLVLRIMINFHTKVQVMTVILSYFFTFTSIC